MFFTESPPAAAPAQIISLIFLGYYQIPSLLYNGGRDLSTIAAKIGIFVENIQTGGAARRSGKGPAVPRRQSAALSAEYFSRNA
jgi:hypothetical protein